ncbi:MAG TPA: hypothetical protein VGI39_29390 [Polyangiaceae bacterium]|jgi:hypothetical protein
MTREVDPIEERDSADDEAMKALLKRSLGGGAKGAPAPPKKLLEGVQRRIRKRSHGKFYGDGWSVSSPRVSYVLVAFVMLMLVGVAYFALGPMGMSR